MMVNYYEKIWLEPNNHGDKFWKTKYGAQKVNIIPMKNIKQALFHYRFS